MMLPKHFRWTVVQSVSGRTPDKLQQFRFHLHVIVECPLYNVLKVPNSPMMGNIIFACPNYEQFKYIINNTGFSL